MSNRDLCVSCRFFERRDNRFAYGECRIRAPQATSNGSQFPQVLDSSWCGEHQPIDRGDADIGTQSNGEG